jgi:hypothetical protein
LGVVSGLQDKNGFYFAETLACTHNMFTPVEPSVNTHPVHSPDETDGVFSNNHTAEKPTQEL